MSSHDMPPAPSRPRDSNALCLRVYVIMHKRTQTRALNRACVNNGARVVYLLLCWASVSLNACETHDHHKAVHEHCYVMWEEGYVQHGLEALDARPQA